MTNKAILAIEISSPTSTEGEHRPGVALELPSGEVHAEDLSADARHDDDLMPAIDRLCRRTGVAPASLSRVVVSLGPGGFTSQRVAITTAKVIAEGTGASLVGVPTWHVALLDVPTPAVWVGASKGEHAFTVVRDSDAADGDRVLGMVASDALPDIPCVRVVGDRYLPDSFRAWCSANDGEFVATALSATRLLRVRDQGHAVDPAQLEPIYAREPEAVTKWRELHG